MLRKEERDISRPIGTSGGCDRGPPLDGGVCGKKSLRGTLALEPLHLTLPPPRRLTGILSALSAVLPSPALMVAFDASSPTAALYNHQSSMPNRA
jgi:hypothetical protein